ncbi:DEP domain-containing protein 1B-like isoform X2 [Antedon mediterranea]|uniref:DEP domain-containing protein 1B-like isoform X2 n=1 Tax=Antedon mediterranea TaxID=105859 RepID=UPI003AF7BA50
MEPFRATRLWNGLIKEFRNGIYPKRHRWRMRYYDNCFTSSEAIEFLLIHLHNDPSFGPWVTRDQALRLLTKFIENHVIIEVKSSSSKGPFEDDGRLYRMCPFSPIKKLRSALNSRTNLRELAEASPKKRPKSSVKPKKIVSTPPTSSLSVPFSKPALKEVKEQQEFVRHSSALLRVNEQQEFVRRPSARLKSCKVIPRSIGKVEYQEVWKSSALTRLQRITGVSTIEDFVRVDEIQACDIIQNNLKISHNKIVIIEDKSQDLPHWVLSAMRCLAHWPDRADETVLPSYPGFERDVFKTVSNYFHSQPEPLLTYNLYDIITGSFLICDRRDRGLDDSPSDLTTPPSVTATNRLNSFGSVENLMLDMTMGWTPLTKFTGQSSEDVNRGGFEKRSVNRQPYVTPVNTKSRNQSLTSGKGLCLTDDQSYTIEGLKMCCLLLPSPKRKKLHLLLKLMAKMVNNKQLNLSKQMSTKSLVLQTFWRCILSCEVEVGLDEILAIKVVTYMMEHYDQIMAVSEELKSDVQERMLYLRRSQVKYNETEDVENIPVTFCQQISTDEYREQKLSYSENAISMLLEDIINSKTMAVKDKRKKLKKFKQEYPDIYAKRLPTTSHEAELFPQKPKIKQPMLNMKRSLTKLKSLR